MIVVTSLLSHNLIPDTLYFFRCVFWVGHCMGGANLLYFSAFMIYPEQSPNNISKNIPPCFHDTCSHLFGLLMSFFFPHSQLVQIMNHEVIICCLFFFAPLPMFLYTVETHGLVSLSALLSYLKTSVYCESHSWREHGDVV